MIQGPNLVRRWPAPQAILSSKSSPSARNAVSSSSLAAFPFPSPFPPQTPHTLSPSFCPIGQEYNGGVMARGRETSLRQKSSGEYLCSPFLLPQTPHRLGVIKAGPHPGPPRHSGEGDEHYNQNLYKQKAYLAR